MKPMKYIKEAGMQTLLIECGFNLKAIRNHLRRECKLPKDYDLSRVILQFKNLLKVSNNTSVKDAFVRDLLEKLKES